MDSRKIADQTQIKKQISADRYSAILKTICYADIFDYPLTEDEVFRWVKDIKILRYKDIKEANGVIVHRDNFMSLDGRKYLIEKRRKREKVSKRKLAIAKHITSILKHIPTVKLIGVSGSVAMKNADNDDDIDLFIITSKNTMWLTRLLTIIVVELFSKRRHPQDSDVADKICLNMFVDEGFLGVPNAKRNLFTAHEVCQLNVLYDRDDTYAKFLGANSWVKKFLPNGLIGIKDKRLMIKEKEKKSLIINHQSLLILEWFAKHLQLWYMRKNRTSETITDHYLAFHPKDYTKDILSAFEKRMSLYAGKV